MVNGAPEGAGRIPVPGGPISHLYYNNHDGTFTDVTRKAGLGVSGWGQGVCVGDYDKDGYPDLFVPYYGKNRLFHNERNGAFKQVAEQAGVAGDGQAWGTGCAFVDYDRDGKLDLMVANYVDFDVATVPKAGQGVMCIWKGTPVMCGPRGLASMPNILYRTLAMESLKMSANPAALKGRRATIASASLHSITTTMAGLTFISPATARPAFSIAITRMELLPM